MFSGLLWSGRRDYLDLFVLNMSMVFLSVSHTVKKVPPRNSKNTRSRHFLSIQNKKALRQKSKAFLWSGRRDSNSQQPAWKAGTLAIELLPHTYNII